MGDRAGSTDNRPGESVRGKSADDLHPNRGGWLTAAAPYSAGAAEVADDRRKPNPPPAHRDRSLCEPPRFRLLPRPCRVPGVRQIEQGPLALPPTSDELGLFSGWFGPLAEKERQDLGQGHARGGPIRESKGKEFHANETTEAVIAFTLVIVAILLGAFARGQEVRPMLYVSEPTAGIVIAFRHERPLAGELDLKVRTSPRGEVPSRWESKRVRVGMVELEKKDAYSLTGLSQKAVIAFDREHQTAALVIGNDQIRLKREIMPAASVPLEREP